MNITVTERRKFAERCGIEEQYLYQILTGRRPASPELSARIERESGGRLACEHLRPDLRWLRIPDAAWPHPSGRPALEIAPELL